MIRKLKLASLNIVFLGNLKTIGLRGLSGKLEIRLMAWITMLLQSSGKHGQATWAYLVVRRLMLQVTAFSPTTWEDKVLQTLPQQSLSPPPSLCISNDSNPSRLTSVRVRGEHQGWEGDGIHRRFSSQHPLLLLPSNRSPL